MVIIYIFHVKNLHFIFCRQVSDQGRAFGQSLWKPSIYQQWRAGTRHFLAIPARHNHLMLCYLSCGTKTTCLYTGTITYFFTSLINLFFQNFQNRVHKINRWWSLVISEVLVTYNNVSPLVKHCYIKGLRPLLLL